ncbi:hypothetical protein BT96DRAFT_925265 [Gymnopus androsaceus JB14]|uniref:TPR-like protein n=1 Tax=Gymnopus androsaceus JB14 TaxID=1447944 RepID=A0A6A4H2E6_9AGAR|nr:hypothetical protein BT96DRAFT_925265 [Gymnopus androsaceus JB14]
MSTPNFPTEDPTRAGPAITKVEAMNLPDDDEKAVLLHNAGIALLRQFEHLGELSDSEQAIGFLQQALKFTPDGDPDKPGTLMTLGSAFQSQFRFLGELADIDQAIYFK